MGRPAAIWWNAQKGKYYATIGGKSVGLSADREQAQQLFDGLRAKEKAPELRQFNLVKTIANLYLDTLVGRKSYANGRLALGGFTAHHPGLRVCDIRAVHVQQWVNAHPEWSASTQHTYITYLVSCLNWAKKPEQNIIDSNPIAGLRKPPCRSRGREAVISDATHQQVLTGVRPYLRDVLTFLRATGCRPGTALAITAADVDFGNQSIIVTEHKTADKTGRNLHIPIPAALVPMLQRLCAAQPTGTIFRGQSGKPLTARDITTRICRLKNAGRIPQGYFAYGNRHTVATVLLQAGHSEAKVATVLGHTSTAMLQKNYGHLDRYNRENAQMLDSIQPKCADPSADGQVSK